MDEERRVKQIKFVPSMPKLYYNVGIYCRISTRGQEQLHSMANQVSWLTQKVAADSRWRLSDIYLDFRSGTETDNRKVKVLLESRKNWNSGTYHLLLEKHNGIIEQLIIF